MERVMLNFPPFSFQVKEGKIFCELRRKWLVLTPEEWVRQHFARLLTDTFGYPRALLRSEGGLSVNRMGRRSDLVMYDRDGAPFLLVECKAPEVQITNAVLEQAERYNHVIRAPYLVLTNGLNHFVFSVSTEGIRVQLEDLPAFG
ncbi:MAG: type I restriction enzyme HsdR N-terminal domain-containing protein [Siphonobacter aquaeclarae]|nr:type I restriction enzyme HsdR N-terminal domain-containing protein [Siphonobacter aquaeclarae]